MTTKSLLSSVSLALLLGGLASTAQARIASASSPIFRRNVGRRNAHGQGVADAFARVNKTAGSAANRLASIPSTIATRCPRRSHCIKSGRARAPRWPRSCAGARLIPKRSQVS